MNILFFRCSRATPLLLSSTLSSSTNITTATVSAASIIKHGIVKNSGFGGGGGGGYRIWHSNPFVYNNSFKTLNYCAKFYSTSTKIPTILLLSTCGGIRGGCRGQNLDRLWMNYISKRWFQPNRQLRADKDKNLAMLMTAIVVMVLGLSYAAVPLYRIYCQKTGKGGQAVMEDDINQKVAALKPVKERKIRVRFEADKSARLAWDFKPSQPEITCSPGETVLAFYTAHNQLDRPVNGVATYTILPYEAGQYFNKIQCFCFEEQQLNPNEEVDLPVFFFIDPEYNRDPFLFDSNDIVLSYNFFETREGVKLPQPPPVRRHFPAGQTITASS